MAIVKTRFRSPVRRLTRQKSGFTVSGEGTGSKCKIEETICISPVKGEIQIEGMIAELTVPALFQRELGIIGSGLYFFPDDDCSVQYSIKWEHDNEIQNIESKEKNVESGYWSKSGVIAEISILEDSVIQNFSFKVNFFTSSTVSIYGCIIGALLNEYFIENDVYDHFNTKTNIYVPELLYINPIDNSFPYNLTVGKEVGIGHAIVCKSCNRCSRFLPINVEHDRQAISYSNHCVQRAPCSHSAFCSYPIESGKPDKELREHVETYSVKSYHGHQLECRVCKKFFVNAPLNPKRNSTQHREDSLRRRALEVLVDKLLEIEWIYHRYRVKEKKEFDIFIWKKFDCKCFNCNVKIKTPNDMHLDHTMPLSYLWPLDDTATCLCATCNSEKHNKFPVDYYSPEKLAVLTEITGLTIDQLSSRTVNMKAAESLFANIEWFFDAYLSHPDYQKIRQGKRAADLIVKSIHEVLITSGIETDLVQLYQKETGHKPGTVTLSKVD